MSIPITYCYIVKAIDNESARAKFIEIMRINQKCGHYTIHPCTCEPPCRKITEEELEKLQKEINEINNL